MQLLGIHASASCKNDHGRNLPSKVLASSTVTVKPSSVTVTVARYMTISSCTKVGARSLTFTKLTPRSNAARYRTSDTDTDNTCGRTLRSVNFRPKNASLPGASVLFPETDSSWSMVKTRLGLSYTAMADYLTQSQNQAHDVNSHAWGVLRYPRILLKSPS